jgi:2-dehydropantoate 2-reductase
VPNNNMLVIGNANGEDLPAVGALRAALETSGMSSPAPREIRQSVWAKLVQNVGNSSLCLLTQATVSDVVNDPLVGALNRRAKAEAEAIAAALGIDISQAPRRPSGGQASGAVGHKPSMLQDYERGRPMEVEAQLMAPLALARQARVKTPTLDMIIPLAAHKAAAKGLYSL